ncbi:YheC/YheD family protein [Paenibacillus harenae]|uniref:Glutathione synthase/RimK-type ligase-like ATP-grasp enzyme n=1 Tax=Paenibacillus harenae TaxID=306543 RepID=A0ABT9U514_PAEHA|nr:YheC/YheD family protein [Paenibacillus harenae]MDQ0114725.1 glutathione synthase/RimK-type ligase-like ATP-grasp enzyme [Paenibacillus harenae]
MDVNLNKAVTANKADKVEDGPKAEVSIKSNYRYRRLYSRPKKKKSYKVTKKKWGPTARRFKSYKPNKYSRSGGSKYVEPVKKKYVRKAPAPVKRKVVPRKYKQASYSKKVAPPKRKKAEPVVKVSRSYKDKWVKTKVLLRNRELSRHVPKTKLFSKQTLYGMLRNYGMVYAKPVDGQMGIGVMRVELNRGGYSYQNGLRKSSFGSYDALYSALVRETKGKVYVVQKGINLLKHKGRPFDIRLMVQKSPHGGWEATGTLGRVAHPRKIVTNGSQGGSIYPTALLLKKYSDAGYRNRLLRHMDYIGLVTAKQMRAAYPGLNVIGLDLALDKRLKPWILEVNTSPDPCPFTLLPDQTMLRRIIKYAKAYGRRYALNCGKAKRGV